MKPFGYTKFICKNILEPDKGICFREIFCGFWRLLASKRKRKYFLTKFHDK